jgi:hypothetical protein
MSRALCDRDVLTAFQRCRSHPPLERALAVLELAERELEDEALAALPVGERDGRLLDLFAATFGRWIEGLAACPACGERLEVAFDAASIRVQAGEDTEPFELERPPYRLLLRLPTSADLRSLPTGAGLEEARRALAEGCVLEAYLRDRAVALEGLPEELVAAAGEAMAVRDPQADVRLDLVCPACRHRWQAPFDIGEFLWGELHARAQRLISEVHSLALAYGWSEAEILDIPAQRRRLYLELLSR